MVNLIMRDYALAHGVAHLLAAERHVDARKMMLDVEWILARANDGVRLMEDYRRLKGDRTMEVVGQAISLSLSDLRKDSRRVVGQLIGRLMAVAGVGGDGKAVALLPGRTDRRDYTLLCFIL